jgi:hypothetical protein
MGIGGGLLFLAFNAFILLIIRWYVQLDSKLPNETPNGLFAMRKNRKSRSVQAYKRLPPSDGWQGAYRPSAAGRERNR